MKACESEQIAKLLVMLFDDVDEAIYVSDPETYELLFVNKKVRELFGEKILGKKCYKVFQNLESPCPFCTNKHIFGENLGKAYVWEFQNRRNKRWYRCIDKAIPWVGGKHVRFEIAFDITEQKNIEKILLESERRYENLIENLSEVVYTLSTEHGIITSLNKAFEKLTGWKREEWIGKSFAPLVHPDDLPIAMETFQKALRGERSPPYELRILSKSGDYLIGEFTSAPLFENGKIVGEMGVARDITQRKLMEEALREREELFRLVIENSHSGVVIVGDNHKIVYVNDELCRVFGYSKEELVGQDFRKFICKESKSSIESKYLGRQKGEPLPSQYELTVLRKDGEKRIVEIKAVVAKEKDGKVKTIAQILDITERKLFEKRLAALHKYGQHLSMARSMNEICRLTLEAANKILGFEFSDILIVEGNKLCLKHHRGYSQNLSLKLPLDGEKGITVKAAKLGKPVYVPDVTKDEAYVEGGVGIRSELAVPIKVGKRVLGVLNVESQRPAAFTENDKKLLEILASYAAIAITNLKRHERISMLNVYSQKISAAQTLEEVYNLTQDVMEKILGFEYASILIVEGKKLRLVAHRGYPKKLDLVLPLDGEKGVTVKAVKTGLPIFVPDVRKEKAYVPGIGGMLSELAVPMKIGNRVLGVLNVESERTAAFDEEDRQLLQILASHAAHAISNLKRQEKLRKISERLENLMKSSTEIMQVKDMHKRLKVIAKAIQNFGWRRVVISLRDENLEGIDLVTAGLTREERKLLLKRKAPGHVWRERLGPKFEKYKIGEFYYLPWSDPWIREHVHGVPPGASPDVATTYAGVPSRLSPDEMVDWHPQDMLYAPLRTPEGRIVGILSMDDPVDGRRPTQQSLVPLELFLHQAAITIENAQLIENLKKAQQQIQAYAEQLEQKVEERTRELKESHEQLLKAQRLATIGELAGMVGHDLRNPLTSIAGAIYYLRKHLGNEADKKVREMLDLIGNNIAYSNKIINDLLDYSRAIELELSKRNLKSIIGEVLSLLEIPRNIKVVNLVKRGVEITIDVEKVKRAFTNIIKNALDAMPKGGTLTIKSRKLGDFVEISFSDTGVGMTREMLEKLWTPLFTTKAKGMGFGLAICKRFIEAHGGSISVESAPGKGTTFTVKIPIEPKINLGGEKVWVKAPESSLLTTTKT
ncbi:MAG: PAS domain S-box protein [Candidatus Bathyarchaeia archaeon]